MAKKILALLVIVTLFITVFSGCKKRVVVESYFEGSDVITTEDDGDSSDVSDDNSGSGNNSGSGKGNGKGNAVVLDDPIVEVDKTGVAFIDDELEDWSKMYKRGGDLALDSYAPAMFLGDDNRVKRYNEMKECWMTWKMDSGITEVGVVIFGHKGWESLEVSVSKDGKTWTKLTLPTPTVVVVTEDEWVQRIYKIKGIDKANKYLKVDLLPWTGQHLDKNGEQMGNSYFPNLGRVRINNLATMDDPDRFLEGRSAKTFYVDSKNGSDNNDGTSENKAFKSLNKVSKKYFQAGDKILFKSGQTFNGNLKIRGQGTANSKITVGTYGGSAKAKISARSGVAISVKSQYITIENLEITNPNGERGIYVMPFTTGVNKNIVIKNCFIHDIDKNQVNWEQGNYESAGITVEAAGAQPTWFDGLTIENNVIEDVNRVGIIIGSEWAYRPGLYGHKGYYKASDDSGRWPAKNVVVRSNTITRPGGDSIMILACEGALIEKNTSTEGFYNPKKKAGVASAGIWTWGSNDNVFQYNDVGFHNFPTGCSDGEAFDIDISEKRVILQYNYSHDNEGGFLLMCNDYGETGADKISEDAVVRFNLSVNDGNTKKYVWMIDDANKGTMIYNNTTYISSKNVTAPIGHWKAPSTDFTFVNNIFVGGSATKFDWSGMSNKDNAVWGNVASAWPNSKFNNNIMYNVNYEGLVKTGCGLSYSNNITDQDPKFKNQNIDTTKATRAQAIAAFTPTNKIRGAVNVANNGGKDIAGNKFTAIDFFGCVKY